MSSFYISKFGVHQVKDRKKILGGAVRQVLKVMEVTSSSIYILWEYISNCFGKGYWINEQPWDNSGGWAN